MDTSDTTGILDPPVTSQPVGIYGWRKRCIYAFVLILLVAVVMNLALTVWILRVMRFSLDGMGRLTVTSRGLELDGEAEFTRPVYAEEIVALEDSPLYLVSSQAVELIATRESGNMTSVGSSLTVDQAGITARCDEFRLSDSNGTESLVVSGGQLKVSASLVTPQVSAGTEGDLSLVANSSRVIVTGDDGVVMKSDESDVKLSATKGNIKIKGDNITLSAQDIRLRSLRGTNPPQTMTTSTDPSTSPSTTDSYNSPPSRSCSLCVCSNGRLFHGNGNDCSNSPDICVK